nr:MAG TPA: hypothetical protein [Microviridae sp.]
MRKGRFYLTCRVYTPCIHPLCYSSEAPSSMRTQNRVILSVSLLSCL